MSQILTDLLKQCFHPHFANNVNIMSNAFTAALTAELLSRLPQEIFRAELTTAENKKCMKNSIQQVVYRNSRGNRMLKTSQINAIDCQNIHVRPHPGMQFSSPDFLKICQLPVASLLNNGELDTISAMLKEPIEERYGNKHYASLVVNFPADKHIQPCHANLLFKKFSDVVTECYNLFQNDAQTNIHKSIKRANLLEKIINNKLCDKQLNNLHCAVQPVSSSAVTLNIYSGGSSSEFMSIRQSLAECESNLDNIVTDIAVLYDHVANKGWQIRSYFM